MTPQQKRQLAAKKVRDNRLKREAQAASNWERIKNMSSGLSVSMPTSDTKPRKIKSLVVLPSYRGSDTKIKSLATKGEVTPKKQNPKYTGTNMLGVATMHKSNLIPVFSKQEAIDISKMRRG